MNATFSATPDVQERMSAAPTQLTILMRLSEAVREFSMPARFLYSACKNGILIPRGYSPRGEPVFSYEDIDTIKRNMISALDKQPLTATYLTREEVLQWRERYKHLEHEPRVSLSKAAELSEGALTQVTFSGLTEKGELRYVQEMNRKMVSQLDVKVLAEAYRKHAQGRKGKSPFYYYRHHSDSAYAPSIYPEEWEK